MLNNFVWLMNWYQSHFNGDWEPNRNIHIGTIDNPGWSITINLYDTELEEKKFDKIKIDKSEEDWLVCCVKDFRFEGYCGALNLVEVLQIFRDWAENKCPP